MQKLIFSLFLCAVLIINAQAQIQTPSPSPLAKVSQGVGLINIDIEYSRPSLRGRKAFGGLVPFGEVWRTGANQAVKLTFGGEVSIAGATLKKGDYTILTTPGEKEWKIAVYNYIDGNWGGYVEKTPAATLMAPVEKNSNTVETFTIGIDHIRNDAATLFISWENTLVKVPVQLPTDKAVMANIDRVMGGPSGGDYMAAARYYWESGKDLNRAIEWMNKGLEKVALQHLHHLQQTLKSENSAHNAIHLLDTLGIENRVMHQADGNHTAQRAAASKALLQQTQRLQQEQEQQLISDRLALMVSENLLLNTTQQQTDFAQLKSTANRLALKVNNPNYYHTVQQGMYVSLLEADFEKHLHYALHFFSGFRQSDAEIVIHDLPSGDYANSLCMLHN